MLLQEETERERERERGETETLKAQTRINRMLAFPSPPSPSPPPPSHSSPSPVSSVAGDGHSSAPSLLIIVGIIAFVITASASIHLLLRLISRSRSSSSSLSTSPSSSSSPPSPIPLLHNLSVASNDAEPPPPASDREKLISSLPIFTLASSVSPFQKSQTLDCAVCLSNFRSHDELRLLPACRHAFHSQCVDTWLRSTPSCPLCRASIHLPPAAAPPPAANPSRSGSFRVELGSVSRRRPSVDEIPTGHGRSYSLGSSFEYLVDEEVEAVLERLRRVPAGKQDNGIGGVGAPPAPGSEVAEAAGNGGRGWLRDCVDRLTSSASSSFNSLRFSGRIGSHQFDPPPAIAPGSVDRSWDLEASGFVGWEESGFGVFYRWLVGV